MTASPARRRRLLATTALLVLGSSMLAGCGGGSSPTSGHRPYTSPGSSSSTTTLAGGVPSPAPHPSSSVYLGAWINPDAAQGAGGAAELAQLPAFTAALGHRLAILHVYTTWSAPAPVTTLRTIAAQGATPLLDWGCGPTDAEVVSGSEDQVITAYALALRSYGKPVFLRWFWEMNLASAHAEGCLADGGPSGFVAAWRHIRDLFARAGATNVAFVWCPGVARLAAAGAYYPGNDVVDWIGIDGYDRRHLGAAGFSTVFGDFYRRYAGQGKPLIVAETGAEPVDQTAYLAGIATSLPTLPAVRAVVYFDGAGPEGNWSLSAAGLRQLGTLAKDPLLSATITP